MGPHPWKAALGVGAVLVGVYLALPAGLPRDVVWQVNTVGCALAIAVGIRRNRPSARRPWRMLLAATAALGLAGLAHAAVWDLPAEHPIRLAGDVGYLLGAVLVGLTASSFARRLLRDGDEDTFVDGAIVVTALATVLWGVLFAEGLPDGGPIEALVLAALVGVPAWILAAYLRLFLIAGARLPAATVLCGLGVTSLAAGVGMALAARTAQPIPTWVDVCWIVSYQLVAAAALHPSMRRLSEPVAGDRPAMPLARVVVLGLALLAPSIALFTATDGRMPAAVVASVALSAGVCWRFARLLAARDADRRALLARSRRQARIADLAALGLSGPELGVMRAATEALVAEQVPGTSCRIVLPDEPEPDDRRRLVVPVVAREVELARLVISARRALGDEEHAVLQTVASILAGVLERHRIDADMRRRALHDDLTGLPNRALLVDRLEQALERRRRDGRPLAVAFADLDEFKAVNDSLGHAAGDALLREVARRISGAVRSADTVGRFAGDEFVMVLQGSDADGIRAVVDRVAAALREPVAVDGAELAISGSVGLVFATEGCDAEELLLHADWAMYRAKQLGRDRVEEFDEVLRGALLRRTRLERDLPHAAGRGELQLVYQPFIALSRDGEDGDALVAVEALLRWAHPELGAVPPVELIPVAEATGAIAGLGEWVLEQACRDLVAWRADLDPASPLSVFVNVSPVQLGDAAFTERVDRVLTATGADPRHVGVEITESAVLDGEDAGIARALGLLRARGLRIALDDFGTGYSSLTHLRRVPVDLLKIDASFITGVEQREDRTIVSAVAGMAQELGVLVLAEGVEQAAQLEAVRSLGCDLAQGYHLGRPVPAPAIAALLDRLRPAAHGTAARGG
jgi:diguanylate cyclase (GGDEF)-like protein